MKPKDILPVQGTVVVTRETKVGVATLQHDQFEVCKPLIREIGYFRKRVFLVHRTAEGKWDIRKEKI